VTTEEARREAARLWLEKSAESQSAGRVVLSTSPAIAVARAYYACFYAACAVLILEDRRFVRHSGVRTALHKYLVQTGRLSQSLGKAYDELMTSRHQADYETAQWTQEQARKALDISDQIVAALKAIIPSDFTK